MDRQEIDLHEEPDNRFRCPVTWYLSMAPADNVFLHHTTADLENRLLPLGAASREFAI